jgi:acylphosphatase
MSEHESTPSSLITCRFKVTGHVQGVFFRDSTKRVADSLGLVGHAINLDDGSVEVMACGDEAAIETLQAWLCEGPPLASVTAVIDLDRDELIERCGTGFRTG